MYMLDIKLIWWNIIDHSAWNGWSLCWISKV